MGVLLGRIAGNLVGRMSDTPVRSGGRDPDDDVPCQVNVQMGSPMQAAWSGARLNASAMSTSANPGGAVGRNTVMGLSDESLLAGLGSNDPEAAAAFVRRFQGRVFGLAMSVVGDRELASDVAQEAFVRAWKHAAVFDPRRASVATWLLTITRNLALDMARVRRPVPMDPAAFATLQLPSTEPVPDDRLLTSGELIRMRRAVADLPGEQRRSLLLAVFHGLTAREISELDLVPLGTVKTRIRTALLKLRSALEVQDG